LQGIKSLVERTIAVRVAVAEDEVVNVSQAPDELPLGGGRTANTLFQRLPLIAVVHVPRLAKRTAGVRHLHRAPIHAIILEVRQGLQSTQTVRLLHSYNSTTTRLR
jgi:hypothetical protein